MSPGEFADALIELEVEPARLRMDPDGATWLPEAMVEMARRDADCAHELAEFVALELALHGGDEPEDPFFCRQVMDRLPEVHAVDDRRRTWILASAYALAIGVAYLLLGPALSQGHVASWFDPVRGWYEGHAASVGGISLGIALLGVAVALVLLPAGGRRRAEV